MSHTDHAHQTKLTYNSVGKCILLRPATFINDISVVKCAEKIQVQSENLLKGIVVKEGRFKVIFIKERTMPLELFT